MARVGIGVFEGYDGYRLPRGTGVGWAVVRTGRPVVVDDYAEYPSRAPDLPARGASGRSARCRSPRATRSWA